MNNFTIEKARELSTKDLLEITWDWYKDVHGFKPRHWNLASRDSMLAFIEHELKPETIKLRQEQYLKDEAMIVEMEVEYQNKLDKITKKII